MDEKKEYLNEENYQNTNEKIKIAGIVIILIGLVILGFGIYTLVDASSIEVPKMGEANWFDINNAKSEKEFTGSALCMVGFFITVVGCMVRFLIPNQRNIMAYQMQQVMPLAKEGTEKMAPYAGTVAKEITKGIKEGLKDDK